MNKAELIQKISKDAGITKLQATLLINSLTDSITKTLKNGGKVTLNGFGTFAVSKRAARQGRNPHTGALIKVKNKNIARFKAANIFQNIVGGGTDDTGPMRTKK
ncbi:HU family DNA-binding protein [Ginsengibacter hankyongi]|uniref:HU family DNA-binding protein n=1 Tax=Ginsengibacter hankyongi TaxID=2607284 RepID=A0A5J5ICH7_9BACT|nr:HU family DNA-binding protein [Ginsengibacter hankyongi]KAA9035509.1 HU family DNA-binding protein [Ginsengibacter hankyongi]